ncbi:Conserved_hypothetical protein [Hexamita inflata]|uniref:Cilia- and flagella-associated protein 57 n=1 Tax=Hexamita inflata TaxID=28002 RepID=A0AA86TE07_9EUKA|nr:Conserved hypothetical protein [Hexamita inflata]
MATITMDNASIEIEPFNSLVYSTASPFSFPVDQHTMGYLTSRYIVLHCIPLREERYLALPANVVVLKAVTSAEGDLLGLLEQTPETVQLTVYSTTSLKRVSTIVLAQQPDIELPFSFEFGQQAKFIVIHYNTKQAARAVVMAWQRAQADDIINIPADVSDFKLSKQSMKSVISHSENQIRFYRQTDTGLSQFEPTRLPTNIKQPIVSLCWITSQLCASITACGEVLLFQPPRYVGFVNVKNGIKQSFSADQRIQGRVTCTEVFENKLIIGTDKGELLYIELLDLQAELNILQKSSARKKLKAVDEFELELQDDELFDMLPKDVCNSFGGVQTNIFPHKILNTTILVDQTPISNITFNHDYAIVESNQLTYIWNIQVKTLIVNNNTLNYKEEMTEFQLSSVEQIKAKNQKRNQKDQNLQSKNDIYAEIVPEDLDQTLVNELNQEIREDGTDVAAMGTLLTLQKAQEAFETADLFSLDSNSMQQNFQSIQNQIQTGNLSPRSKKAQVDELMAQQEIQNNILQKRQNALPPYLNNNTPASVWCDILTGFPASNLPVSALKQFQTGPRSSLQSQSLIPPGFRENRTLNVKNVKNLSVSENSDIMIFQTGKSICAAKILNCQVFATIEIDATEISQLIIHPQGTVLYAVYDEGIGMFSIQSNSIQLLSFTVHKGIHMINLSHGGGYLAVGCDKGVPPTIKLQSNATMQTHFELKCHNSILNYLEFLPGDSVLVSSSIDGVFYGHSVGSGERVFETILRNVKLQQSQIILGKQMEHNQLNEEIEIADESRQKQFEFMNKKCEDFVICGVDVDQKYYEIANGRQLHQIQLPKENITCFQSIPQPPTTWNNSYSKLVADLNNGDVDTQKAERDTQSATAAQFGKQFQEQLDIMQKDKNISVKLMSEQVFDEEIPYHRLVKEIGNIKAEEFSERPIKFFLVFSGEGYVSCFEWPLRDNQPLFKQRLHQTEITSSRLIKGSILITVSVDQLLISNIRYLIPAQAIFGANARNKCLNKLKMLYDSSQTKLMIRLPITRLNPPFSFITEIQNSNTTLDALLQSVVQNMSEVWNYTDFRVNTLKELERKKRKMTQEVITLIKTRFEEKMKEIKQESIQIEQNLVKYDLDFKKYHQETYKKVQTKYYSIVQQLKEEISNSQQKMEQQKIQNQKQIEELKSKREKYIQAEKTRRHVFVQEKELEIDRLDEALAQFETTLNEELRQIKEEKQAAIQTINDESGKSIDKEQTASSALKGWYALQERRLQTLKQQKIAIVKEQALEDGKLASLKKEYEQVQKQCDQQKDQIQLKDRSLLQKEQEIERLKQNIYVLNKTQFVLSHQINELRSEIRPRDDLINDMKERQQDLSIKLEESQSQWSKVQKLTEDTQNQVHTLNKTNNLVMNTVQQRVRQLIEIQKCFTNFVTDSNYNQWFSKAFEMLNTYKPLLDEIILSAKKQEHAVEAQDQFVDELDQHKSYLQQKLTDLYQTLFEEDQKFNDMQTYALDENQALLQESHRLKDENIALNAQLQKISAMLQALKVKDLTNSLKQKGLYRAQSQLETSKSKMTHKYGRDMDGINAELGTQSIVVKGLLGSIDGRKSEQSNKK